MESDWQEEYKRKLVPAGEAVKLVNSGDRVEIGTYPIEMLIPKALAARRHDLTGVETAIREPDVLPWFEPGWEGSFSITMENHVGVGGGLRIMDEKRADYYPVLFSLWHKPQADNRPGARRIDVFICVVSPPDKNGFCSFGASLWNKRILARQARVVLAEVDPNAIRTYGTNYIHVSEIDRFVENSPVTMSDEEMTRFIDGVVDPETRAELEAVSARIEPDRRNLFLERLSRLSGPQIRRWAQAHGFQAEPDAAARAIGEYAAEVVPDGATIQVGGGTPSTLLPGMGVLDNKHDLGIHSEMSARGLIELIEKGVATGKRKNFNTGKAIFSSITACTREEVRYAHNNPLIELHGTDYVVNIRNVSANDNMVSINSALSVDLTGQINAETVFGGRLIAGTGGQPELHMGAVTARGGRAITCLRSTAMEGVVSRVVAQHDAGAAITVTRGFADFVVTEYGVASLMGKTFRQRAEELIAVAHPDFRGELRKEARRLFYP